MEENGVRTAELAAQDAKPASALDGAEVGKFLSFFFSVSPYSPWFKSILYSLFPKPSTYSQRSPRPLRFIASKSDTEIINEKNGRGVPNSCAFSGVP